MSNAFKCDRCGEFFEKSTKQPEIDCLVVGHKSISQLIDHTTVWYDICPKCVEELTEWLKKPTQNLKLCNRERCNGCERFGWIADKAWDLGYYTCSLFNAKVMNQSCGDSKCEYANMLTPIDFKNAPFILHPIPDENEEEDEWTDEDCDCISCWECKYFRQDKNIHNPYDEKGAYYCSHKKLYISGNVSRPDYMDMRYTDFDKIGCKEEK